MVQASEYVPLARSDDELREESSKLSSAHSRNVYTVICTALVSLAGLLFGFEQGVIANILVMKDFQRAFPINAWHKGFMIGILELGCLFGSLVAPSFADRYSRRRTICAAAVIFCIGSTMQCAANTLSNLTTGRAIGGLGIGALSMLAPLYISEVSQPHLRGRLVALEELSIVVGVVLGFWTGYFTRNCEAPSPFFGATVQILPGVILGISILLLPPSPRFLVMKRLDREASEALSKLRMLPWDHEIVENELLDMLVERELLRRPTDHSFDEDKYWMRSEARSWLKLFSTEYRPRTLIAVLVMFFQQWSGINALLYYGPTLLAAIGMQDEAATLIGSGGIGIMQVFAVVAALPLLDSLGRRPLLIGSSIGMAASHLSIAIIIWYSHDNWSQHQVAAWSAVGCTYIFTVAFGLGFGSVGWVLPSELFPISVRAKGVGIGTASTWLNNFLVGLMTPALTEMSPVGTFALFGFACVVAGYWSYTKVPETAGVPLEDLDRLFGSSIGRDDTLQRREIEAELRSRRLDQ